ncbi:MAG: hypothetical protein IJ685_13775 [Selenomonadaceae bacterium]|nr:hypothetical protein [Selenomonadaceae bacterium]
MRVDEKSFRELWRQICLLEDNELVAKTNPREVFDFPPDEKLDGFLTYAHVDDNKFVFEILAGAQIVGGKVKVFPASYKKSKRIKRGDVADAEIKILTADYSVAFRDRIQMIGDRHVDAAREQTRLIKTIDIFRHPDYPDDVAVYFFDDNRRPEILWVRCKSVDENILTGELLIEPRQDFNLHAGDEIKFGVAQVNAQNILIHLPR